MATGSLETSLARRAAESAYWQLQNNTAAMDIARSIEADVFNQTRLSIQELLDCDTQIDQGCVGGNPLLAFFYIHKYGLTSWEDYPYLGTKADTCGRLDRREVSTYSRPKKATPIATVESWGILPKNHEDIIQVALRYIGPVAVAINGGDNDFIGYAGGIFDKKECGQEANHAVLIVGYGEEEETDGSVVRYWIVRNSWGTSWGENGYMRILRGPGGKKIPGICGMAASPSVALGGRVLFSPWTRDPFGDATTTSSSSSWTNGRSSYPSDYDLHDGLSDDGWPRFCNVIIPPDTFLHVGCRRIIRTFDNHRAASLAVLSLLVVLLLAFPLTYPCRRRQERLKLRRRQLEQQAAAAVASTAQASLDDNDDDLDGVDHDDHDGDPSAHGSLSLSSEEEHRAQFAILEDDLENEKTLMIIGNTSKKYGSIEEEDHSQSHSQEVCHHGRHPSKESSEISSSFFSASSGRSWFFLQR